MILECRNITHTFWSDHHRKLINGWCHRSDWRILWLIEELGYLSCQNTILHFHRFCLPLITHLFNDTYSFFGTIALFYHFIWHMFLLSILHLSISILCFLTYQLHMPKFHFRSSFFTILQYLNTHRNRFTYL